MDSAFEDGIPAINLLKEFSLNQINKLTVNDQKHLPKITVNRSSFFKVGLAMISLSVLPLKNFVEALKV